MAGKNGKNGGTSGVEEEEVKATEAPKAEVTKAAEPPKPDATPEDESTYVSQMMFGQKTYDQQMKDEKHFAGLNRTDEIAQLGGASKLEVDLAQMKIFSTERIGDDLYAAIMRGDTHKVEAMAGLNSDRRLTEAQILVLLKAKREHDDDIAKKIAQDAYYTQELESKKKHADDEAEFRDHRADDQNARTSASSAPTSANGLSNYEPNFENAGWDDEGNYHNRHGDIIDQDGYVYAQDGTVLDNYNMVTHTNGDEESIYGDVIPSNADRIDFKDENGVTQDTLSVDDLKQGLPPGTPNPPFTAAGERQWLRDSYRLFLESPAGGSLKPEEALKRSQEAERQDLKAFKESEAGQAAIAARRATSGGSSSSGPATVEAPVITSSGDVVSPSVAAQDIFVRAGVKVPDQAHMPSIDDRKRGATLAGTYLASIPTYSTWANAAGAKYEDQLTEWRIKVQEAKDAGQKVLPKAPKPQTPADYFKSPEFKALDPVQAAALKKGYEETLEIDSQVREQMKKTPASVPIGSTPPPVLGTGTDPNADPAIAKVPEGVDTNWEETTPVAASGYYDEYGGYYDAEGGYDDGMGNYYAADGGWYDAYGGYTFPDGAYEDKYDNYVDKQGNLYTSSGEFYAKSDYPNTDFKDLLRDNAQKADNKNPFAKDPNVSPSQAFNNFTSSADAGSAPLLAFDPAKPISLFAKEDGTLTMQDTGKLWDPLSTPYKWNTNSPSITAPTVMMA